MRLVVSLHDISPGRLEEARRWCRLLDPLVEGPLSLLVVPCAGGRERWEGDPAAAWVRGRALRGDELVLHGLTHRDRRGRDGAELAGRTPAELAALIGDGRRELAAAGLETEGMIPPAYGTSPGVEAACWGAGLGWWADRWSLIGRAGRRGVPSVSLGASRPLRRVGSRLVIRPAAHLLGRRGVLRIDLHMADFDHPVLARSGLATVAAMMARGARPVTHRELLAAP